MPPDPYRQLPLPPAASNILTAALWFGCCRLGSCQRISVRVASLQRDVPYHTGHVSGPINQSSTGGSAKPGPRLVCLSANQTAAARQLEGPLARTRLARRLCCITSALFCALASTKVGVAPAAVCSLRAHPKIASLYGVLPLTESWHRRSLS